MSVFKIVLFGIIAAFCAFSLREIRSDISIIIGIVAGVIVLIMMIGTITGFIDEIKGFFSKYEGVTQPIGSIVKIVLTGFIGDIGCSIMEDCGQKSLADKVSLAVKIIIIAQIFPVIKKLFAVTDGIL